MPQIQLFLTGFLIFFTVSFFKAGPDIPLLGSFPAFYMFGSGLSPKARAYFIKAPASMIKTPAYAVKAPAFT
jgi:hypothetical protein